MQGGGQEPEARLQELVAGVRAGADHI